MKFSIRDLLLGTMIVAIGVGWAVDRTRLHLDYQRAIDIQGRETTKWFERADSIADQLRENGWKVEWLDEGPNQARLAPPNNSPQAVNP